MTKTGLGINILTENNPWLGLVIGPAGVIYKLVMEIFGAVCVCLGSYKLFYFVRREGPQLSVSQLCLFLDVCACLGRDLCYLCLLTVSSADGSTY